jgi:hypothetical protein
MANVPISNLTTTWNNVSTTFTGIKLNVTDTASAAASLLMDLQVGGSSKFSVGKGGEVSLGSNGSAAAPSLARGSSGLYFSGANGLIYFTVTGSYQGSFQTGIFSLRQQMELGWESGGAASGLDLRLFRDAANTLAQRNGVNAQTFRLYNTFTDGSNYERGFMRWNSNILEIGAEAAGTGTQRQLQFPLGTVTASTPLSITQTWNNAAITFTGVLFNATDTASAAASNLMDLQVGGSSKFRASKGGEVRLSAGTSTNVSLGAVGTNSGIFFRTATMFEASNGTNTFISAQTPGFTVASTMSFSWSGGFPDITGADLLLFRDAASTLAQRDGVNAQTHRLYGTYTDASNYRRLTKTMSTGGVAAIRPEGAGTGASGNVLHISGLPTSNPGPGILWNNLGVVNVGT